LIASAAIRSRSTGQPLRGRGGLARFLYGLPDIPPKSDEDLNPPAVDPHVRKQYADVIRFLLGHEPAVQPNGAPCALHLSPEALELLQIYRAEINDEMTTGALTEQLEWANKLAGAVVRIAAIFHCVQLAHREIAPESEPIDAETISAAILLAREYLIPHALAAFQLMEGSTALALARRILSLFEREERATWKRRDIHHRLGSGLTSDEIEPALNHLEDCGYIRRVIQVERERKPGRKPGDVYEVNPILVGGGS
jgi:replicative DNA helicase